MRRIGTIGAVTLVSCLGLGCGGSNVSPVLTAEVVAAGKLPFHGPSGPGSEPISITFSWTVVVRSAQGPDCEVDRVMSELSEPQSQRVLSAATEGGRLPGGGTAQVPQQQAGFFDSSLFARPWNGHTRVDVTCPHGVTAHVEAAFTVP
jgi:hypothetical protein